MSILWCYARNSIFMVNYPVITALSTLSWAADQPGHHSGHHNTPHSARAPMHHPGLWTCSSTKTKNELKKLQMLNIIKKEFYYYAIKFSVKCAIHSVCKIKGAKNWWYRFENIDLRCPNECHLLCWLILNDSLKIVLPVFSNLLQIEFTSQTPPGLFFSENTGSFNDSM